MAAEAELIDDLNTLNQIAVTLNQAADTRSALHNALAQLVSLMGLKTGWIFVRDPAAQDKWAGKGYALAAYHNLPPALALDNPAAWYKGCDCQALCNMGELTEAYNEVRCSRLAEAEGSHEGLSVHASTPLRSGDQTLGILNVAAPDWSSFNARSLALLTNVGHHMGIALERARLFDMLRERRILEQGSLLSLTNRLLSRLDLDEMMCCLLEEVHRLLHVDASALVLPGDEPDYLYFRAALGWRNDPVANGYRVPMDTSGSGRVMRTQQPLIMEDDDQHEAAPWVAPWLMEEGFRAAAIVPLIAGGRSIGTLVIDAREPRRFTDEEIRFLQLMANQAALAIEKERLHQADIQRHRIEEELAVGRQIQLSMLPDECPVIPGWQIVAAYEAAHQVGGDFYDFFPLPGEPEGRLGLVIADVSENGVPAALFMALSRTTIRNTALRGRTPAAALAAANRFIRQDSQSDMFLTAFYAILDTENGRLVYANAGHNRPLWWQAATGEFRELTAPGIALGILDDITLEEREIVIAPADVIVFYTDGVTEAMDADFHEFGVDRLKAAVTNTLAADNQAAAQDITAAILKDLKAFTGDTPQHDDYTLLVVRRDTQYVICDGETYAST